MKAIGGYRIRVSKVSRVITGTTMLCLFAPEKELGGGWINEGRYTKPFLYANCAPKAPHRCCKSSEDAITQAETFHEIFVDRNLL